MTEQSQIEYLLSLEENRQQLDRIQRALRPKEETDPLDTKLPIEFVSALFDYPTRRGLLAEKKAQLAAMTAEMPHLRTQAEALTRNIDALEPADRKLVRQSLITIEGNDTTITKIAQAAGGQLKLSALKGMSLGELGEFARSNTANGRLESQLTTPIAMRVGVVYAIFGNRRLSAQRVI